MTWSKKYIFAENLLLVPTLLMGEKLRILNAHCHNWNGMQYGEYIYWFFIVLPYFQWLNSMLTKTRSIVFFCDINGQCCYDILHKTGGSYKKNPGKNFWKTQFIKFSRKLFSQIPGIKSSRNSYLPSKFVSWWGGFVSWWTWSLFFSKASIFRAWIWWIFYLMNKQVKRLILNAGY